MTKRQDHADCSCDCHNGYQRPCSMPGGCGLRAVNTATITDLAVDIAMLTEPRGYWTRITALLPQPGTSLIDDDQPRTAKVIGSPAPWNDTAAGWLFDIHAGARRHETRLRQLLHFNPITRSGSDRDTHRALLAIPDLANAASSKPEQLDDLAVIARIERDIATWCREARRILDDDPLPHEKPKTRAPGNLRCPHCNRTLWLLHGWQHEPTPAIWCLRCPSTKTDELPAGENLKWDADVWLGVLQHGSEATA